MSKRRQRLKQPQVNQSQQLRPSPSSPELPDHNPPVFSLRYLDRGRYGLSACQQREKAAFADTLHKLSQLTWQELRLSQRHGLGYETIARQALRVPIPQHITDEVRFIAFRFYGKAPMVGYRVKELFYVIWLDRDFTLYDHG